MKFLLLALIPACVFVPDKALAETVTLYCEFKDYDDGNDGIQTDKVFLDLAKKEAVFGPVNGRDHTAPISLLTNEWVVVQYTRFFDQSGLSEPAPDSAIVVASWVFDRRTGAAFRQFSRAEPQLLETNRGLPHEMVIWPTMRSFEGKCSNAF